MLHVPHAAPLTACEKYDRHLAQRMAHCHAGLALRPPVTLQERVPGDTLLVYHTLHVPHQSADPGMWENDPFLPQHVKQLNAAGRHVAQSLHYHVIDIEAMAAQISKGTLLVDNTHPGPDFMMQARSRPALSLSFSTISFQHCAPYGTA